MIEATPSRILLAEVEELVHRALEDHLPRILLTEVEEVARRALEEVLLNVPSAPGGRNTRFSTIAGGREVDSGVYEK